MPNASFHLWGRGGAGKWLLKNPSISQSNCGYSPILMNNPINLRQMHYGHAWGSKILIAPLIITFLISIFYCHNHTTYQLFPHLDLTWANTVNTIGPWKKSISSTHCNTTKGGRWLYGLQSTDKTRAWSKSTAFWGGLRGWHTHCSNKLALSWCKPPLVVMLT